MARCVLPNARSAARRSRHRHFSVSFFFQSDREARGGGCGLTAVSNPLSKRMRAPPSASSSRFCTSYAPRPDSRASAAASPSNSATLGPMLLVSRTGTRHQLCHLLPCRLLPCHRYASGCLQRTPPPKAIPSLTHPPFLCPRRRSSPTAAAAEPPAAASGGKRQVVASGCDDCAVSLDSTTGPPASGTASPVAMPGRWRVYKHGPQRGMQSLSAPEPCLALAAGRAGRLARRRAVCECSERPLFRS